MVSQVATTPSAPSPATGGAPARVLFVDHTASMGGGEVALLNLASGIDARRFTPIVALFSDGPLAEKLRQRGVETHVIPLSSDVVDTRKDTLGPRSLFRGKSVAAVVRHAVRLARFIRAHGIDLVHTNSLKADLVGGLAARLARRPVVWHVRDRIEPDYLPGTVVRAFRLLCRAVPDYIIANSVATLQTLHLPPGSPSAVIASGIDAGTIRGAIDRSTDGAARSDGHFTIGLVGRISRWKGQHVFLRAAARVRERFPHARFQIVGAALFDEAEYERDLHELADSLGLAPHVEFTGFRSDARELIERMDLLVHASITGEPLGQVLIEGMAAGKPVVATRGGGVPEIVLDGETGLLVPMGDDEAMAGAICRLLADPEECRRMGAAGQARVAHHFTLERTTALVHAVYEQLLR